VRIVITQGKAQLGLYLYLSYITHAVVIVKRIAVITIKRIESRVVDQGSGLQTGYAVKGFQLRQGY
jgi:hypothetical protein